MSDIQIPFFEEVHKLVPLIPKGRVTTYAAIAEALGKPGAARQVGYAMNHCPKDLPAHRVVNRKGVLTGKHHFGGENMAERLKAEGISVENDQILHFADLFWHPLTEINP
jgi:methylated-DNA-protein-cysteine methyltransferase-like protein